jgi:hypothetical protein
MVRAASGHRMTAVGATLVGAPNMAIGSYGSPNTATKAEGW